MAMYREKMNSTWSCYDWLAPAYVPLAGMHVVGWLTSQSSPVDIRWPICTDYFSAIPPLWCVQAFALAWIVLNTGVCTSQNLCTHKTEREEERVSLFLGLPACACVSTLPVADVSCVLLGSLLAWHLTRVEKWAAFSTTHTHTWSAKLGKEFWIILIA